MTRVRRERRGEWHSECGGVWRDCGRCLGCGGLANGRAGRVRGDQSGRRNWRIHGETAGRLAGAMGRTVSCPRPASVPGVVRARTWPRSLVCYKAPSLFPTSLSFSQLVPRPDTLLPQPLSLSHGCRSRRYCRQLPGLRPPRRPQPQVVQQQEARPSFLCLMLRLTPASRCQAHRSPRMARPAVRPSRPSLPFLRSPASAPSLITSSTNGFDGSLMNSLQSMKQWESFFNKPHGGTLGLLNAIQVRLHRPSVLPHAFITREEHRCPRRLPLRALPLRRPRPQADRLDRCGPHDGRCCPPDRLPKHPPVHRCSVRALRGGLRHAVLTHQPTASSSVSV